MPNEVQNIVPFVSNLLADNFRVDVLAGLAATPKTIPARWLYDRRGSELFEAITELPEYYPTRTERSILREHAREIATLTGSGRVVVEFGSGSSTKTPLLLSAIAPKAYVPIDISGDFLRDSSAELAAQFPRLSIVPLEADFLQPLILPAAFAKSRRLGFFPGSTIGNMLESDAADLLRVIGQTLGDDSMLLIGIDRMNNTDILLPAYDDAEGVTAMFNLNLLWRINREMNGDIPLDAFEHFACWNAQFDRIEMHLRARRNIAFFVEGRRFSMAKGETIHTENSHKYSSSEARLLLKMGGWTTIGEWSDEKGMFGLLLGSCGPHCA